MSYPYRHRALRPPPPRLPKAEGCLLILCALLAFWGVMLWRGYALYRCLQEFPWYVCWR